MTLTGKFQESTWKWSADADLLISLDNSFSFSIFSHMYYYEQSRRLEMLLNESSGILPTFEFPLVSGCAVCGGGTGFSAFSEDLPQPPLAGWSQTSAPPQIWTVQARLRRSEGLCKRSCGTLGWLRLKLKVMFFGEKLNSTTPQPQPLPPYTSNLMPLDASAVGDALLWFCTTMRLMLLISNGSLYQPISIL